MNDTVGICTSLAKKLTQQERKRINTLEKCRAPGGGNLVPETENRQLKAAALMIENACSACGLAAKDQNETAFPDLKPILDSEQRSRLVAPKI